MLRPDVGGPLVGFHRAGRGGRNGRFVGAARQAQRGTPGGGR
jgi:hypothetical protein